MNKSHCNYIIESEAAGGRYRWCMKKRGHYGTKKFPNHQFNMSEQLRLKIIAIRKTVRGVSRMARRRIRYEKTSV